MHGTGTRHGFTLVELLVVLGILVILSTIGVAAFISSGKVNRLAATEQLIGSQIRQARYTARATGQAVLIYIDKEARTVSGVSRTSMWQGSCEAPYPITPAVSPTSPFDQPPFEANGGLDRLKYLAPNGHSGTGFCRRESADASLSADPNKAATVTFFEPGSTNFSDGLARNRQLTRSSSKPTEGFSLSCAVRPATITKTQQKQPLLLIGDGAVDTHPLTSASYAGILLKATALPMYPSGTVPTPAAGVTTLDPNPKRYCWDIIGWVMPQGSRQPFVISSLSNSTWDGGINDDDRFLRDGDAGGRWEEIALVYTGTALALYRDGIEIAHRADDTNITILAGHGVTHRLYIGSANIDTGTTPPGVERIDPDTIIDDIALFRLGTDQPGHLAPGVFIDRNVRLRVVPSGMIYDEKLPGESLLTSANDLLLKFHGVFAEEEDTAEITITPGTGLISSSHIKLSKSAP